MFSGRDKVAVLTFDATIPSQRVPAFPPEAVRGRFFRQGCGTSMSGAAEEIVPNAGNLVESLRDFGYTLQSALADLIDNSLTADATKIEVAVHADNANSHIAVIDNGTGMDQETLVEAMRMGGAGPLGGRAATDLGRFGLGLKTASLSQGRCLTVISRSSRRRKPVIRRWDIPYIQSTGKWQLLDEPTPLGQVFAEKMDAGSTGTVVLIEKLDRPTFLRWMMLMSI